MIITEKIFKLEYYNADYDTSLFFQVAEELFWQDCYIVGSPFLAGDTAFCYLYNLPEDQLYIISDEDISKLGQGESITLYGTEPEEHERKMLVAEGF